MSLTKVRLSNLPVGPSMTSPDTLNVVDNDERERALDTSRSFIVRAPAGSGKTRLLIQRYLALLERVSEPEEIVAITFTRKAAAEMRQRVMDAFMSAQGADGADDVTQRLAAAVLARDAERGWQILSQPSRLRMQTIDSLNASITRQMPLLARFGAQPESVDDASALYREAAQELLGRVNDGDEVAADVATLLTHLDNNIAVTENLLADVLRSRDHWLRNLRQMHERETLEATLARVRSLSVARVAVVFPQRLKEETLALARIAGQNMAEVRMDIGPSTFDDMAAFPDADALALPAWLALADLLLTKEGTWRKRVDKRQGFPTSTNKEEKLRLTEQKNRMTTLLQELADIDTELPAARTVAATLHGLRDLPAAAYSENQWRVLGAIVRLLPHATAMLWRVFGQHGQCDFTEIGAAASRALGQDDAPTDLALALDYRISHLLVDEFQDTSFAQFELLEKLTRGWNEGDGRTLFLVGDPMQSIYRFREAEVSLFSRAWREGVGGVGLQPLTLRVNFRSEPGIVEWVNASFGVLMPDEENASVGAVPYSASVAFTTVEHADSSSSDALPPNPSPPGGRGWPTGRERATVVESASLQTSVKLHVLEKKAVEADDENVEPTIDEQEAQRIVTIIASTRLEKPDALIAILVRNRGHLHEIVPALKAANIDYLAVDIDPLKTRPVVQDLISLTRALLHPADRIAWLAMLRAPWCGLTLADLTNLANGANPVDGALKPDERTVWELLNDATRVASMSADGQVRVANVREVVAPRVSQRRRLPLREAVESTWLALRGPACLHDENDLSDVAMLFDLLESEAEAQASGGQLVDVDALQNRVDKLYAGKPNTKDSHDMLDRPPVQIMTIHKAKGLEFDTVIVPGLHRPPRRDDKKLMVWTEQPNAETGHRELLLAPVRETGAEEDVEADSIYRYVMLQEREKERQEIVRLLYVAATRAERRLHLLGAVDVKRDEDDREYAVPPRTETLLAALWPAVKTQIENELAANVQQLAVVRPQASPDPVNHPGGPMRLIDGQPMPAMAAALSLANATAARPSGDTTSIDFEWAGEAARHVGTVAHAFLQRIREDGIAKWDQARIKSAASIIERELVRHGVAAEDLPVSVMRVTSALTNTLADTRGAWALQAHTHARAEWRLTGVHEGKLANIAIDRTFVDANNVRWIIDFKTGSHEGGDVEAFLDNEQSRYRAQLDVYAAILNAMDGESQPREIRLGLYFPMLKGWREWGWRVPASR